MAADTLLLKRYPESDVCRFRHYGWHRPALTFGYSQKLAYVRAQLAPGEKLELCRRPTGGGVVDHRNDWTYSLVIPRGHVLEERPAPHTYRTIHAVIAETLRAAGQPARLNETCPGAGCQPAVCFAQAEMHDVVHDATGRKIAGAALKRTKQGLLVQGSLARAVLADDFDYGQFQVALSQQLADTLGATCSEAPWPEWDEAELDALREQYGSAEWNEFR